MSGQILAIAVPAALVMQALAILLAALRLLVGPSAQDRILALDNMYAISMFIMLTLSIYYESDAYFEAALLIALLGFASTTAMAKFLLRGEVIE